MRRGCRNTPRPQMRVPRQGRGKPNGRGAIESHGQLQVSVSIQTETELTKVRKDKNENDEIQSVSRPCNSECFRQKDNGRAKKKREIWVKKAGEAARNWVRPEIGEQRKARLKPKSP
ncbi:hypothetical protein J3459_008354 [Metarhizium acridum]|nr:hypothetical protein J3459_008354 [Metarhizium acridum]